MGKGGVLHVVWGYVGVWREQAKLKDALAYQPGVSCCHLVAI